MTGGALRALCTLRLCVKLGMFLHAARAGFGLADKADKEDEALRAMRKRCFFEGTTWVI